LAVKIPALLIPRGFSNAYINAYDTFGNLGQSWKHAGEIKTKKVVMF